MRAGRRSRSIPRHGRRGSSRPVASGSRGRGEADDSLCSRASHDRSPQKVAPVSPSEPERPPSCQAIRGFPTFCRGAYAQDQGPRGKVIDFRTPVEIEGVRIAPGDLIFGDREGVLIVPAEVESEAVAAALAKASTENKVATAIRGGMSAREAFETFGVL